MSTHFSGEGNIGSPPEYREFPNGNDEPSRLLRLNVYFDNPVPKKDGTFHTDTVKYGGKYDAGGRLRPEFRNTIEEHALALDGREKSIWREHLPRVLVPDHKVLQSRHPEI